MGVVFVDVDGTLLRDRGSERLFVAHLAASRLLGSAQLLSALMFFLRHGLDYGRFTLKKNKAYFAGLECAEVAALAKDFVRDRLEHRLRPALLRRLEQHRAAGEKIALLSGTPDFIAEPLAERVRADVCGATRCARTGGKFCADPPEVHPFAEGKLRCALEICAATGFDLAECTAYGDSIHDVPLLERVGRPVAVQPGRKLARVARRRGWEILAEAPAPKDQAGRLAREGSRL